MRVKCSQRELTSRVEHVGCKIWILNHKLKTSGCYTNQMCLLLSKADVLWEIQEDLFCFSVCIVVVLTQAVLDMFYAVCSPRIMAWQQPSWLAGQQGSLGSCFLIGGWCVFRHCFGRSWTCLNFWSNALLPSLKFTFRLLPKWIGGCYLFVLMLREKHI